MLQEQESTRDDPDPEKRVNWTPSKIIHRLGKEINNEESVCYWAYKNNIPIFCPALTDGSLGDMLYFHTFKAAPAQLRVDLVEDIRKINTIAVRAKRAGMIILGGGVVKHHIANACLMRNGAESAVYINTAQEFDGSDAGARPDEAVSRGQIIVRADSVKVCFFSFRQFLYWWLSLVFLPLSSAINPLYTYFIPSHPPILHLPIPA
jgi:deoxyhypusine synthase